MKKIRLIMTIFICIVMISVHALAANEAIEVSMSGASSIEEGTTTYVTTLKLGAFTNITEGKTLGFEGKLEFDKTIFEGVTVEGLNGWTITYSSSTNKIVGDTTSGKPNMEIAKLTFTLKNGINAQNGIKIKLGSVVFTDGTFEINKELETTFSITEKPINNEKNEVNDTNIANMQNTSNQASNSAVNTTNKQVDNTTAKKVIPAAGIRNFIMIGIVILIIAVIIFKIKSKDIKY